MERNFRVARVCAVEAFRDFSWREYAPFGWLLGAQLLFLLLALNLDSVVGMGTVGSFVWLFYGDKLLHYPGFFLFLPSITSIVEALLYALPGAVLIPLSLIRIMAPMDATLAKGQATGPRLRKAIGPTLLASIANAALLTGWQWILGHGPAATVQRAMPGIGGDSLLWALSLLGAYTIAALFVYIPIVAVAPGATFREAVAVGLREGLSLLRLTLIIIFFFAFLALPLLYLVQLRVAFIVERLRPELVVLLLALYAAVISFASYLTYAAAARLHWTAYEREES